MSLRRLGGQGVPQREKQPEYLHPVPGAGGEGRAWSSYPLAGHLHPRLLEGEVAWGAPAVMVYSKGAWQGWDLVSLFPVCLSLIHGRGHCALWIGGGCGQSKASCA